MLIFFVKVNNRTNYFVSLSVIFTLAKRKLSYQNTHRPTGSVYTNQRFQSLHLHRHFYSVTVYRYPQRRRPRVVPLRTLRVSSRDLFLSQTSVTTPVSFGCCLIQLTQNIVLVGAFPRELRIESEFRDEVETLRSSLCHSSLFLYL